MTDKDLSAPEAVERLISGPLTEIARSKNMPVTDDDVNTCKLVAATLRALSAENERLRMALHGIAASDYSNVSNAKDRARAALQEGK